MVLMTMIGRAEDGLPLAASMQADEQVGRMYKMSCQFCFVVLTYLYEK